MAFSCFFQVGNNDVSFLSSESYLHISLQIYTYFICKSNISFVGSNNITGAAGQLETSKE